MTPDDAAAGNKNNNASYRQMTFAAGSVRSDRSSAAHVPAAAGDPGLAAADPAVVITNVDFPNDGRFIVAKKVTSLGGGNYHYEFAVHNLNSDRSGRGFTVDFPAGHDDLERRLQGRRLPQRRAVLGHRLDRRDQRQQRQLGDRATFAVRTRTRTRSAGARSTTSGSTRPRRPRSSKTIEPFKPDPARPTRSSRRRSGYALDTRRRSTTRRSPAPIRARPATTSR